MKSKNIKVHLKVFLLLIACTSILLLSFSKNAAAAATAETSDGFSFGIFPPVIKISARAPSSIQTEITVFNFGTETTEVEISTRPFMPGKNLNGEVTLLSYTPESWKDSHFLDNVHLFVKDKMVDSLKLGPKQQQVLTLKIDIPKNETDSDYYFSILLISKDSNPTLPKEQSKQTNSSRIIGGVGTNVIVSIGDDKKPAGYIEKFSTPVMWEHGPVSFLVQVKNSGIHSFTPDGQILIKNLFGQTVGNLNLVPVNILADSSRIIPSSPSKNESSILNQSVAQAFWNEKFLLGPYTATLKMKISDTGPVFERTVYFMGIPSKIFLGIGIGIFLVLFIVNRVKQKI